MRLPSVKDVTQYYPWKRHKIETKTLELRPFEKSDMSPYLIHMTSEKSILSILESGENSDQGKINSETPSQKIAIWYDAKIVCFTETPIFALDFFRYKSHKRWLKDLRYGLGFSKKALADKGVRPALYVDRDFIRLIASMKNKPSETTEGIIYSKIVPLITPLDHESPEQGFMWEREWRYPDSNGFSFDYSDIEIICCPKDEVPALARILGQHASNIKFIETWGEYEEISDYLQVRNNSSAMRIAVNSSGIDELKSAHLELSQEVTKLQSYKNQIDHLNKSSTLLEEAIPQIQNKIISINERLERQKWLDTHCCVCQFPFADTDFIHDPEYLVSRAEEWSPDDGLNTWICIDCKLNILRD